MTKEEILKKELDKAKAANPEGNWVEDVSSEDSIIIYSAMELYKNQELSELQAKYEALEQENFKLAAYQCNTPVTDEHWSLICKEKTVLYANNSLLQAKYDKLKNTFLFMFEKHYDYGSDNDYCLGGESKEQIKQNWLERAGLIDDEKQYKILDCNGIEMPDHGSGRRRTLEEAKEVVKHLNENGEHAPYRFEEI